MRTGVFVAVGLALGFAAMTSGTTVAQSSPTSLAQTIDLCTPVIRTEYSGDKSPWGQCVAAVDAYLKYLGAPSAATDAAVVELVVELTKLYQEDPNCKIRDTELPLAIQTAAQKSNDSAQQARIYEIRKTIVDCVRIETAAIALDQVSPF